MQLARLWLTGFRRFLHTNARLHGRLIALVGPNEAGKSSLLDALEHLNSSDAFPRTDISRGQELADDHPVLRALFLLEDADRDAIGHLPEGKAARWFIMEKLRRGTLTGTVEPALKLQLQPRQAAARALDRLLLTKWALNLKETDEELALQLSRLGDGLEADTVIPQESRDLSKNVVERLDSRPEGAPKTAQRLADQLRDFLDKEPIESPQTEAVNILLQRRPLFLKFSQDHRDLQSVYELDGMDLGNPPVALQNLASLARLDLRRILQAVQEGDYAACELPLERANEQLKEFFTRSWTQSGIAVRLSHHETRLHVLISTPGSQYTDIQERSDGLRQFLALSTFAEVHGHGNRELVLLIDEAETHLHYDAQADLVRVLDLQRAASSVIYTTHSAGCLPEDLGSSVRVVLRTDETWSEVQNAFWTKGVGFDPLLLGMGASALVFGAVRRAVIAEGATDLILLPALLREANGLTSLGYQVAPGVAEVSQLAIADLELQAAKAAYVVDDDAGGRAHARKLRSAGIEPSRIFVLGRGIASGLAVEDLVRKDLYLRVINAELKRSGRKDTMKAEEIPEKSRSTAVRKWCEARGYSEPKKVSVATALALDAQIEAPVLSPLGKSVLRDLHSKVTPYFKT